LKHTRVYIPDEVIVIAIDGSILWIYLF